MNQFAKFLTAEMKRLKIESGTEFARQIGVAASTVNSYMSNAPTEQREPTISFLRKLSRVTGRNIKELLALAYPDLADALSGSETPLRLDYARQAWLDTYERGDVREAANLMADRVAELSVDTFLERFGDQMLERGSVTKPDGE